MAEYGGLKTAGIITIIIVRMLLIQRTGYQPSQQNLLVKLIIDANRQIIMITVPVGLIIIITLISPAVSAEHAQRTNRIFPLAKLLITAVKRGTTALRHRLNALVQVCRLYRRGNDRLNILRNNGMDLRTGM